ncbi:hypothetical protein BDP27DRAFT_1532338 [Rhodocollybia butyracea]|uniref:Uncharacterized protein n=1 Tax=Rhodocollybia butyracea TaxID=206335 RepID=A0A9P5PQT3_9AGAR|nr:hypothetical protein BDP27DRAFT_1532338 [Rhodocollybia butyracea]
MLSLDAELRGDYSFVKTWLSRSRCHPLDIYLYFPSYSKTVTSIAMDIMDIIAEFHTQIRVFKFRGSRMVLYPLVSLQHLSLPLLETVSLKLEARSLYYATATALHAHRWVETQPSPIEFLLVPKLRDLEILGCEHSDVTIAALVIPFEQLTSVKVDPYGAGPSFQKPEICIGLLQRCNNVVALEIHVQLGREFYLDSPVLLPALRSFTIRNDAENIGPIPRPFLKT